MKRIFQLLLQTNRYFTKQPIITLPKQSVGELRHLLGDHVLAQDVSEQNLQAKHELTARTMEHSFDRVALPLGSNLKLRDKFITSHGYLRFGMLLEDLDTFAVWLAYRHNQDGGMWGSRPTHPPMGIVTACVDRIDMEAGPLYPDRDVIFEGFISWVGRSSLEATMHIKQINVEGTDWVQKLSAKFVMVAKNPKTGKSTKVHPLSTLDQEEKNLFDQGEANKNKRQHDAQYSLLKEPPASAERSILHDLFLKTLTDNSHSFAHRVLPENYVWMEDCKLKNCIICFPQQRNLYGKIFGGFLMRSAFELAYANASTFSHARPVCLAVDDIMFRRSVDVGDLLFLSSEICYSDGNLMQVRVHAEVVDAVAGTQETTNTFHFTMGLLDQKKVPLIMPKTYADGMLYLSGMRKHDETVRLQGAYSEHLDQFNFT